MGAYRVVKDLSDTRIMHSDCVQDGNRTARDRIQSLCSCLVLLSTCPHLVSKSIVWTQQ